MNKENTITLIVILIVLLSAFTAGMGIVTDSGPGRYEYESIRGETVQIYGKGIYQQMSADVAVQGIAQDYITLFAAIPILLISMIGYRKKSVRARFLLAGTFGYFLVTYLLYTAMSMYNSMFLAYTALLGLSFFGVFITLKQLSNTNIVELFSEKAPYRFVGWFLIVNSVMIAFLWFSIILPPLFEGTIYPVALAHYTTLIVQGFDLGLFLPLCFVAGFLLLRKKPAGYLYGTTYVIFLSVLMTSLTAKIIAMAMHDVNVIPVIVIIPSITVITIVSAIMMISNIKMERI